MEVSGLLKGTKAEIAYRVKEKLAQAQQSDDTELPLYVIIVEFRTPIIKIIKR